MGSNEATLSDTANGAPTWVVPASGMNPASSVDEPKVGDGRPRETVPSSRSGVGSVLVAATAKDLQLAGRPERNGSSKIYCQ